jgi:hypothetical protein
MIGLKHSLYNPSIFSGSSDTLRTAIGGYWTIESESDSNSVVAVFTSVGDNATTDAEITTLNGSIIGSVKSGYAFATTSSADIALPSLKMPIRLVGNEDFIESDFDWQTKIQEVYSPGTKTDTSFVVEALYPPRYIKAQDPDHLSNYKLGKINYNYNYYIPVYQTFIRELPEATIPNYYFYISKYLGLDEHETVDNYTSIEGNVESQDILNVVETSYPPTYDVTATDIELTSNTFLDKLHNIKEYLSSSFSVEGALSASTTTQVGTLTENLYFNVDSQVTLFSTALEMKDKFPLMTTLSFPVANSVGSFGQMILRSDYENLMLNYIKRRFVENIDRVPTSTYTTLTSTVSSSSGAVSNNVVRNSIPTRQIDFFTMPMDTLVESSEPNPANFYIVGGQSEARERIVNTGGTNCYAHSIPSLSLLQQVRSHLDANFYFSSTVDLHLKDILDRASEPKSSEVVAYRIQKSVGARTPATARDTMIQNFIISNCNPQSMLDSSENRDALTIYDSQVKYGEPYTYVVYAYVVVSGYDYSYSDLVVSRQIANTEDAESKVVHCLEFSQPGSDEASPALYSEGSPSEGVDNSLFTEAQVSTYDKYLADLNISVEPSLKILEIPIFSKVVTVLDHPLQSLNTHKFQRMNDSKIIGFFNNIEPFVPKKYPNILTGADALYKASYLRSNDLLESEKISTPPRAKPSSVQIFRRLQKPTSFSDFNETDLITEKSLLIKDSPFALSNCLYEEKVNVNTKYYYVFRMRNQNRTPGHLTNVIEAELVDDGGYLYSVFEEYGEGDFDSSIENQISERFKKIIRLVPNINQISFDDTDVDYDNIAASEIDNLTVGSLRDSIFGKTFKIRLTSKKTGKKIDLNVTYKLI